MCKVYLYSRVSTSAQTLAQQERTVYEWLNNHNMTVGEIISDEGVSGGVSYKDRNLGKVLLPMLVEGDMLIVSEISRLGRSMFDLSKLIHTELKPRKVRLVVCSMGIDLNCSKMTAIDELILNNFSFAAQLEKQLISERTLSALQVKRKQGVKLGASNEKYISNYKNLSAEQRYTRNMKKGVTKRHRHHESKEFQVFLMIIKKVFPEAASNEDYKAWDWKSVNCKNENKKRILQLMQDYKEYDTTNRLFVKFDFKNNMNVCEKRIHQYMQTVKRSISGLLNETVA